MLHPPGRASADALEPFALLTKHHATEPSTSIQTALLLLTDSRWRNGVGQLLRRIADADILPPEQIDLLAESFVAADTYLYWRVPDSWWGDEVIVIDPRDEVAAPDDELPDSNDEPAVAQRTVHPPLRRWAASWLIRRDAGAWHRVYERTRHVDRAASAALLSGLLDAVDCLPPRTEDFLFEEALRSSNHAVRLQALVWLADRKGAEVAYARARVDPNGRVRSWAQSLLDTPGPEETPAQTSLF